MEAKETVRSVEVVEPRDEVLIELAVDSRKLSHGHVSKDGRLGSVQFIDDVLSNGSVGEVSKVVGNSVLKRLEILSVACEPVSDISDVV